MLADAGIAAELRPYEFATFYADVKRGSFQMFSLSWTGVAEPDLYRNLFHSGSIPPAGANRGRYRSANGGPADRRGRPALRAAGEEAVLRTSCSASCSASCRTCRCSIATRWR